MNGTTGRDNKEGRTVCNVNKATEAMHRGLGRAVGQLRARMQWGQADLAKEINKHASRMNIVLTPDQGTISRWESGDKAPSPRHRMVLARIAAKHKATEDLAEIFRAPVSAWRLVGTVKVMLKDDE